MPSEGLPPFHISICAVLGAAGREDRSVALLSQAGRPQTILLPLSCLMCCVELAAAGRATTSPKTEITPIPATRTYEYATSPARTCCYQNPSLQIRSEHLTDLDARARRISRRRIYPRRPTLLLNNPSPTPALAGEAPETSTTQRSCRTRRASRSLRGLGRRWQRHQLVVQG